MRNIRVLDESMSTFIPIKYLEQTVDIISQNVPDSIIVVGGPGFSLFPEQLMKKIKDIDFGVYLEGEKVFKELLDNIHYPQKIKSIFYRKNSQVIFTGKVNALDIKIYKETD